MTAHDGDADKELLKPNNSLTEQSRSVKDNGLSKVDHIPREDGIKINGAINGLKDIHWGAVQPQPPLQIQQQQPPQGATVHWERFLHVRSLKVLLVEYDDSTRHVVSALLRNCSYEVIEASNALQAWKVLEDLNNHIDLVLTEVIMPCLTGIGLLNKIMSHKTRKTVPIIMMSSHDSMGLVFKCLSKGAVDFLLKPVRKNELKNLWQHVWRRCHSSSGSGSGSESCTQTQKSIKSKSIQKSKNNSGSNDEEDNVSSGMNSGDGSDTGGGAQSSWTKRAADTGSPSFSPWEDQAVECADSTCAQVIRSNSETSQNKQGPAAAVAVKRDKHENPAISRDLKEALPRNLNTVLELSLRPIDVKQKNPFEKTSGKLNAKLENWNADLSRGSGSGKERCGTSHMGSGTNTNNHQRESWEMKGPTMISSSDVNMKDVQNDDREEQSWIELSLKRPRAAKDMGTAVKDDRNILRRSNSSAFSRYNIGSHNCKGPGGNTISSSPDEKKSYSDEKEAGHYHADPPNQCSNVGSNNINMGSTANRDAVMKNHLMVTSIKCPEPCSFRQLKGDMAFTIHQVVKEKTEEAAAKAALVQPRDPQLLEGAQPQQLPQYPDEMSMKIMSGSAPHCGSSNAFDGLVEGNAGNYSVNGSGSGSNGNAENDGSGNASGSGCGSGTGANQNKSAQREAALKKFRQKRIERCFHKKVRYQNRNRVADQRSIGGQFVRKDPGSSDYRKHLI